LAIFAATRPVRTPGIGIRLADYREQGQGVLAYLEPALRIVVGRPSQTRRAIFRKQHKSRAWRRTGGRLPSDQKSSLVPPRRPHNNSGAIFTAIFRASSLLSNLAADRRAGLFLAIDVRKRLAAPWSRTTKQASNSSTDQGGRKRRYRTFVTLTKSFVAVIAVIVILMAIFLTWTQSCATTDGLSAASPCRAAAVRRMTKSRTSSSTGLAKWLAQ
jgi:Bacterial aa3 type cytochrome c oxidase subunit IV